MNLTIFVYTMIGAMIGGLIASLLIALVKYLVARMRPQDEISDMAPAAQPRAKAFGKQERRKPVINDDKRAWEKETGRG